MQYLLICTRRAMLADGKVCTKNTVPPTFLSAARNPSAGSPLHLPAALGASDCFEVLRCSGGPCVPALDSHNVGFDSIDWSNESWINIHVAQEVSAIARMCGHVLPTWDLNVTSTNLEMNPA